MINATLNKKKQFFDLWAPNYDFLFVSIFYQAIHQRLLECVNLSDRSNILDLGCGTGRLLNRLAANYPNLQGTGLDFSPEMLRQARRSNRHHPRLIYVLGNVEQLSFAEGQFDAVFNTISFLHYPNPEQVFSEVSRVLNPGGHFYLVDGTVRENSASKCLPVSPNGIKLYSAEARAQLGRQAGLTCLEHKYLLGSILLTIFTKPLTKLI